MTMQLPFPATRCAHVHWSGPVASCLAPVDVLIEQLTQKKVAEIFAEDGEESFRELETQVLAVRPHPFQ